MKELDISTKNCIVEQDGHLLIVTLNRPEAKNAFSPEMLLGMYNAWRLLEEDDELYCAILTANGDTFSAGMDLKAGAEGQQRSTEEFMEVMGRVPNVHWQALLRDNRPNKPLILAVEGYALAGGTEILQGTDIRVAAECYLWGHRGGAGSLSHVGLHRAFAPADSLLCRRRNAAVWGACHCSASAGDRLDKPDCARWPDVGGSAGICGEDLCQWTAGGEGGYAFVARTPGVYGRGRCHGGIR